MLSKTRLSPISTVHFKRRLIFPPEVNASTETTTNASNRSNPSHQAPQPLPPSRLRASLSLPESTQFQHSCSVHYYPIYSEALKTSAKMGFLCEGRQLHCHLVKMGLCSNAYLQSQIMNVYVKCQVVNDAHKVFDEMSERNVVVWNTVICTALDHKRSNYDSGLSLGLSYFRRMLVEPARPDDITLNILFRSCVKSDDIEPGKQLHCFALKIGFAYNGFASTALVDLYAKCGFVEDSRRVFNDVLYRDLVLWNVMIYCYASNHLPQEAFGLFNSMRSEGFTGDEFTFTNLLSSCHSLASREIGKRIHGITIKRSFDADILVASALVDMYSNIESISDARKVFDRMETRNTVSWNTMIVGHRRHGEEKEALKVYREMTRERLSPDESTLASITSSCGNSGIINELKQVHARAVKSGFESFVSVNNALINAYSKCGNVIDAFRCFSSAVQSDLFTWTSIIFACSFHGLSLEATKYFEKMLTKGIKPDRIAFLGVLSACSHGGLVEQGLKYFEIMTEKHRIVPEQEHYTCLVGLIGRAGLFKEAIAVLNLIPSEAKRSSFGALLGACKVHGNLKLAEWTANRLFESEPNVAANYSVLSNMYSLEGRWADVARVRGMMTRNCDLKSPGCSWVEIFGEVHTFVSSDRSHPKSIELYDMLGLLFLIIKEEQKVLQNSHVMQEFTG